MDTAENKKNIEARATVTGPKGTYIPIIANTLVPNLKSLISPTANSAGNYEAYEKALTDLAGAGFHGFIANIDYVNISSTPAIREEYVRQILTRAHNHGLFVIINNYSGSDYGVKVPSQKWFKETADKALEKTEDKDKVTIYVDEYKALIKSFITLCQSTQGFGGVLLKDEPKQTQMTDSYPQDNTNLNEVDNPHGLLYCLSHAYDIVASLLKDNEVLLVNLLPGLPNVNHGDDYPYKNYKCYLEAFATMRGTTDDHRLLWSYDLYPIIEYNYLLKTEMCTQHKCDENKVPMLAKNGEITVQYNYLWADTALMQSKSAESGGIFWYYCQSMSYMPSEANFRPAATEPYLRFQIFNNLAMGCQGIMYWTYHQRTNGSELYLNAPVDMQNRQTAAWYYAKRINAEIMKYSAVFRGSKLNKWGHVGQLGDNCILLEGILHSLTSVQVTGKGVLATSLINSTGNYIVIVNHDVVNYQDITLVFDNVKYRTVELTGGPDPVKEVHRTLKPGGYLIFKWA